MYLEATRNQVEDQRGSLGLLQGHLAVPGPRGDRLVLALVLVATLSLARVDFEGRLALARVPASQEQWQSYTTLIISPARVPPGARSVFSLEFDPSRYATLATIYSNLAQSDAVKRIMAR